MCVECDQHSALGLCGIKVQGEICRKVATQHFRLGQNVAVLVCNVHSHAVRQRNIVLDAHPIRGACGLPDFVWSSEGDGCQLKELTDTVLERNFPGLNGAVGD